MSEFSNKLQHLTAAIVFGGLGILIVTQAVLGWNIQSSAYCIALYISGTLFLAALSSLRGVAHGMSSLGEGMGSFFGSFAAGVTTATARTNGVPTKYVKDALKEAVVRSTVEAISKTPETEPVVNLFKLNTMLDAMALNAGDGKPISRDALVPAYGPQTYWNLANHILKLLGMRKDKTTKWFGRGNSRDDIHFIRGNVQVIDDVVLVRLEGRGVWKRVDLEKEHFIVP